MQSLRKRINREIMFPSSEGMSLTELFASKLYCAVVHAEDQSAVDIRRRQHNDSKDYQLSLQVFAQEPGLVAAQLQYLRGQVSTMRMAPGGTVDTIYQRESEWLRLVRHTDGILWHIEQATEYAMRIRACLDKEERVLNALELRWLIENHADTINWHFIQSQPFEHENRR
ncbi:hypothetical protein PG989_003298 [Apiospora arundinis]